MRPHLPIFLGLFAVMALSNAIVPVLPGYAPGSTLQAGIFSAYFFGALLITLPAGLLSDRFGRIPVLRFALAATLASGLLLSFTTDPVLVIGARFLEGLGGGSFVAAAMSYVNALPDHRRESGYLMAALNAGLVTGVALSGWLAAASGNPVAGIAALTIFTLVPAGLMAVVGRQEHPPGIPEHAVLMPALRDNCWIWYSSFALVGITGVATALYPQYSGLPSDSLGLWIAAMNVATIVAVLVASRLPWEPAGVIRISAILMAAGILLTLFSPAGFIALGALAGIVMIGQMAFLAKSGGDQGAVMGLFSTSGYLGMTALPLAAGLVADYAGFPWAFIAAAVVAVTVAVTIGRCATTGG